MTYIDYFRLNKGNFSNFFLKHTNFTKPYIYIGSGCWFELKFENLQENSTVRHL